MTNHTASVETPTQADIDAAYERWRTTRGPAKLDAYYAYEAVALKANRRGDVCTCGVSWGVHFPVGERGCDHFSTREDEDAAELAAAS